MEGCVLVYMQRMRVKERDAKAGNGENRVEEAPPINGSALFWVGQERVGWKSRLEVWHQSGLGELETFQLWGFENVGGGDATRS
jgi:hypothetical protein